MGSRSEDIAKYITIFVVLVVIGIVAGKTRLRADLTSDRRYTLSGPTREILAGLENDIYIQVYLEGDLRVEFNRLQRELRARLEEFHIASGRRVDFNFINPSESEDPEERYRYQMSLISKGLVPVTIMAEDREGGQSEKVVFPGLIVNYNGIEVPVNFLRNNPAVPAQQNLQYSIEGLEYELISTIATVVSDTVHRIAFIEGHGELSEVEVADLTLELARFFTIDRGSIGGVHGSLDNYSAIVIAGPRQPFSEEDKLVIDQYIMNGGSVLWLIDEVAVNPDSLATGGTMAMYRPLEIEDQLFSYGVRINPVLIQDQECQTIMIRPGFMGEQQQLIPVPWIYNPLLYPSLKSPVTRAINRVRAEFAGYIDTVGLDPGIKKQVLLASSPRSRVVSPPRLVSLDEFKDPPADEQFNRSFMPVAVLLEGEFTSVFRNRMAEYKGAPVRVQGAPAKMIVVADGDIIRNSVRREGNSLVPLTLGQDRYTQQVYGNKDFLVNALYYLVDDRDIVSLRSREMKLRLLDQEKVASKRLVIQLSNSILPVMLVISAGFLYSYARRRRFTNRKG